MKKTLSFALCAVAALGLCVNALAVKDNSQPAKEAAKEAQAPALTLTHAKVLKGKIPEKFEKDKLYVIECWATWCGPCVESIPHVSKLAAKYPKVTFIGMNVYDGDTSDEALQAFVNKMGNKMKYNVCRADAKFEETWLKANNVDGIPHAFLVKNGKIIAQCLPAAIEQEITKAH